MEPSVGPAKVVGIHVVFLAVSFVVPLKSPSSSGMCWTCPVFGGDAFTSALVTVKKIAGGR